MYNFRWKKSRVQIRLILLIILGLLSIPYNSYTLHCYLSNETKAGGDGPQENVTGPIESPGGTSAAIVKTSQPLITVTDASVEEVEENKRKNESKFGETLNITDLQVLNMTGLLDMKELFGQIKSNVDLAKLFFPR